MKQSALHGILLGHSQSKIRANTILLMSKLMGGAKKEIVSTYQP